jgi:hypothetical protein
MAWLLLINIKECVIQKQSLVNIRMQNADYQAIHLSIFIYFFRLSTRGLKNCAGLPKLLKNFVSNHTSYVSGYPEHNLNFYN